MERLSSRISSFQASSFWRKYSRCRSFMNGSSSLGRYSFVAVEPFQTLPAPSRGARLIAVAPRAPSIEQDRRQSRRVFRRLRCSIRALPSIRSSLATSTARRMSISSRTASRPASPGRFGAPLKASKLGRAARRARGPRAGRAQALPARRARRGRAGSGGRGAAPAAPRPAARGWRRAASPRPSAMRRRPRCGRVHRRREARRGRLAPPSRAVLDGPTLRPLSIFMGADSPLLLFPSA